MSTSRGSRMIRSVPCSWTGRRDLSHPSPHTCCAEQGRSWLFHVQATPQMSGPPATTAATALREEKPACSSHPFAGHQGSRLPSTAMLSVGLQPGPQLGPRHALHLSSTPAISSTSSIHLGFSAPAQHLQSLSLPGVIEASLARRFHQQRQDGAVLSSGAVKPSHQFLVCDLGPGVP